VIQPARVFLSSTFADFAWEREVINTVIVPNLNDGLRALGRRLDLIDLRWGVSDEAGLDHAAVDICLTEVERCCASGAKPAFILMRGERRGWRPLPRLIEASAFDALARALSTADPSAAALFRKWYALDENFLPPSYLLRSRRGQKEASPGLWSAVEGQILQAVEKCLDLLPPNLRHSFVTPITDLELEFARLQSHSRPGMIHAMRRVPAQPVVAEHDSNWAALADEIGPAAVTIEYDPNQFGAYREQFEAWILHALRLAADGIGRDAGSTSIAARTERSDSAVTRRSDYEIDHWRLTPGSGNIKLIYGPSGSGKTVLARRLAKAAKAAGSSTIGLYLADTDTTLDTTGFLTLAARAFSIERRIGVEQPAELVEKLQTALASSGSDVELAIVDALEEVAWRDPSESLSWLPLNVGAGRKIVVTTSSESIQQAFSELFGSDSVLNLLELDDRESERQILLDLEAVGRTLQPSQVSTIVTATQHVQGRALVNRVAAAVSRRLPAGVTLNESPSGLEGWLRLWIDDLVSGQGHGEPLIHEALALICASRRTVSERHLADTLGRSEAVRSWIRQAFPHAPRVDGIPRTVVSRLMADLEGMIDMDQVEGEIHFAPAHRILRAALTAALPGDALEAAHRSLAQRCIDDIGDGFDHPESSSAYRLSQVLFQLVKSGQAAADRVEQLVSSLDFLAAKTAPESLADTMEEVSLLRERDAFDNSVIREFCTLLVQERAALQAVETDGRRRAYLAQTVDAMLHSNPLRIAAHRAANSPGLASIRQRFASPRLSGMAPVDIGSVGRGFLRFLFDDELALVQDNGSIAIIGSRYGEVRRRLPGHPVASYSAPGIDGIRLAGNRLLTCGADGEIAVSSVSAGRDLRRIRTGGPPIQSVGVSPSGRIIASSHGARMLYRWGADGIPAGEIHIERGSALNFVLSDTGLEPGLEMRRDLFVPMTTLWANEYMPAFRSFFHVLDDDRVATGGMGSLAVWSFAKDGPEILINQILRQEWMPKYVVPGAQTLTIVSNNGGVARLHIDERRAEILSPAAKHRGGADPLDEEHLFCWSLRDSGTVDALIIHRITGEITGRHELRAENPQALQYFRGGASNVPRGLLSMRDHILGWSGYGCEAIDLTRGLITPLNHWEFDEYATHAAKVGESSALLIKAGRPIVFDSSRNRQIFDLTDFTGEIEGVNDLAGGRLIAFPPSGGRTFYWDVSESLKWIEMQNWSELGRQPHAVIDAQFLVDGHFGVRSRAIDDSAKDFSLWEVHPGNVQQVGNGGQRTFAGSRGEVYFSGIGPLMLTWGGSPPSVNITGAPTEILFSYEFEQLDDLCFCVPLIDEDGDSPFVVSAIVCAGKQRLAAVAVESRTSWSWPNPDGTTIVGLFAAGGSLVVCTEAAVWRAEFDALVPRDPRYVQLVTAEAFATEGMTVSCTDVIHPPQQQVGLALFHRRPEAQSTATNARQTNDDKVERNIIAAAYDLEKGLLCHAVLPDAVDWTPCATGVVLHLTGGGNLHVRSDANGDNIDALLLNETDLVQPASRAGSFGAGPLFGEIIRRARPLISLRHHAYFEWLPSSGRVLFEPHAVHFESSDEKEQEWLAPDGYKVLDLDEANARALLLTERGQFQILEFGQHVADVLPLRLDARMDATGDPILYRLVRRAGRPELAVRSVQRILNSAEATELDAETRACLFLELATGALEVGDANAAARLGAQTESVILRSPPPEQTAAFLRLGLQLLSIKLAILRGDRDYWRREIFQQNVPNPAQTQVYARLWLLAAIELVRRSPERLAILGAFSRELEAALAKLSLNHGEIISAGLLDLSMLIRAAQPPKAEDPTTVDWRALLGPNHQAMLSDAEAGNAGACTNIGVLFGVGKEVTRNPLYAAYWYGRAVDLGSDIAAFNLAQMYRHGEGVGKDPVRAYQLTRLAAERGSVPAKCNVGLMLLNGEGCAADPAEARVWLKAAVDEGDTLAPIPLAMLLASGRGGPRDVDRARAYLAPLVKLGNPRALQLLALIDRGL